jgi:hypothetical protein
VTLAGSPRARELAERETNGVHAQLLWDPLTGRAKVAAARRQEREALSRYWSLILAAQESLHNAEAHFSAASDALDEHVHAALAALARRRSKGRPLASQLRER